MFGRTRDVNDTAALDGPTIDDFFGDESAAEETVLIDALRERLTHVELQISSQFTSLATYAQIAQEQVALARAEAKSSTERSEHRLTGLIERERADRIASGAEAPSGSMPDVTARLDTLEHGIAQLSRGLNECFAQQESLAHSVTKLFERKLAAQRSALAAPAAGTLAEVSTGLPAPAPVAASAALPAPAPAPSRCDPIAGLSVRSSPHLA